MSTTINMTPMKGNGDKSDVKYSIVDDFMYGSNVATAHIYVRMGFLRKVYGIVSTQLLITFLIGCIFMFQPAAKLFVSQNSWIMMVNFFLSMGVLIGMFFKKNEYPTNFVLLGIFTLSMSLTVGLAVSFYDQIIVLEAFLMTTAVTVGLTLYTLQSKRDFSSWGAGLFAAVMVLLVGGMLQMFFQSSQMEILIGLGGAIVFSLFIVFDTHMMMTKLSPEDYILASINLYLDIVNLFLHLLRLLAELNKNN